MALEIYRVGRSVPIIIRNPNKSHVKIQLLTRIGRFRPVWLVSGPVRPVRPGCRSSGRHNSLIRTPNWTIYICILIVSTRSTQWCSPIGILTMLPRPVWPVYRTGLTGLPRLSSKLGICQFWMSTYAPLFLGKTCVPRNISQRRKLHWNNEKHLCQSCLAFKGDIVYRPYHSILLNIFTSVLLHANNASCVSEPSLSTYYLSCELLKHQLKSFSHL